MDPFKDIASRSHDWTWSKETKTEHGTILEFGPHCSEPGDYLYRVTGDVDMIHWDQYSDLWRLIETPVPRLSIESFKITKRTHCGAWINPGTPRFVLLGARKQWASETPERAMEGFIARRRRHIGLLHNALVRAEATLKMAEAVVNDRERNAEKAAQQG
jgi:hypothetical protein